MQETPRERGRRIIARTIVPRSLNAMSSVARAIDANANRAREALRVLEDAARFSLDDAALTERFKGVRHGLQGALAALPPGWLEANRDTANDVGRTVKGEHERQRAGYHAVVAAAGKRLGEALRSIEECLKTVAPNAAAEVERLRYQSYECEREIVVRMGSPARAQWRVCVLLTQALCKRPWKDVLAGAIEGGADAIQVREKELGTRELASMVRHAVRECARASRAPGVAPGVAHGVAHGVAVIVNDRIDVALACGATGAHLGQHDLAIADARRLAGTGFIIGASTHSIVEADAAVAEGADYCGVGAMFATRTKPSVAPQGTTYLQQFIERHGRVAHLAIGGITPANIGALAVAGARGVAVSACVCGADDPAAVVRALRSALP